MRKTNQYHSTPRVYRLKGTFLRHGLSNMTQSSFDYFIEEKILRKTSSFYTHDTDETCQNIECIYEKISFELRISSGSFGRNREWVAFARAPTHKLLIG